MITETAQSQVLEVPSTGVRESRMATLSERVDAVIRSSKSAERPLTRDAIIRELIAWNQGLEVCVREIALEVEKMKR